MDEQPKLRWFQWQLSTRLLVYVIVGLICTVLIHRWKIEEQRQEIFGLRRSLMEQAEQTELQAKRCSGEPAN